MHFGRLPAALDQVTVDHLLENPRSPAGGVLFFPGGLIGRAHHAQSAGGVRQALAHTGAAMHCLGKVVDPSYQTGGTQIRIHWAWVHQHPGVQHVVRVEGSLHLPEDLECGRRVHRRQ